MLSTLRHRSVRPAWAFGVLLTLLVGLASACSSDSDSDPPAPGLPGGPAAATTGSAGGVPGAAIPSGPETWRSWRHLGPLTLPALPSAFEPLDAALTSGGYVLLGTVTNPQPGGRVSSTRPLRGGSRQVVVLVSTDGRSWRASSPPTFDDRGTIGSLAGDGTHAYLLGVTTDGGSDGEVAVWQMSDLRSGWAAQARLAESDAVQEPASKWRIGVGPAGVLVVHNRATGRGEQYWTSRDGRRFVAPQALNRSALSLGTVGGVAPMENGFLVMSAERFFTVSEDGTAKTKIGTFAGMETINEPVLAVNDARLAVRGDAVPLADPAAAVSPTAAPAAEDPQAPDVSSAGLVSGVWCAALSATSDELAFRQAEIDGGQLPDLGVAPARLTRTARLAAYGDGFLLVGGTDVGGVWWSADGCGWAKAPVAANGFQEVETVSVIASAGTQALLVGRRGSDANGLPTGLHAWLAPQG